MKKAYTFGGEVTFRVFASEGAWYVEGPEALRGPFGSKDEANNALRGLLWKIRLDLEELEIR